MQRPPFSPPGHPVRPAGSVRESVLHRRILDRMGKPMSKIEIVLIQFHIISAFTILYNMEKNHETCRKTTDFPKIYNFFRKPAPPRGKTGQPGGVSAEKKLTCSGLCKPAACGIIGILKRQPCSFAFNQAAGAAQAARRRSRVKVPHSPATVTVRSPGRLRYVSTSDGEGVRAEMMFWGKGAACALSPCVAAPLLPWQGARLFFWSEFTGPGPPAREVRGRPAAQKGAFLWKTRKRAAKRLYGRLSAW